MSEPAKSEKWALVRGTNLRPEDRHVLLVLFLFQGDGDVAFSKQETIADEIGVSARSIRKSLRRLNAAGVVRSEWRVVNGVPMRTYAINFETLRTVQRADGRNHSSYPETVDGRNHSSAPVGTTVPDPQEPQFLQEHPRNIQLTSKRARAPKSKFQKPTGGDVSAYAADRGQPDFDAEAFLDYYESNGWRVGRNSMKDWRATVRNWIRTGGTGPRNNGKAVGGSPEASAAFQSVLVALRQFSRFEPERVRQAVGEAAWRALRSFGLKRLDESTDFERKALEAEFCRNFERQGAAA